MHRQLSVITSILFFAIGTWVGGRGIYRWTKARQSIAWPVAQGTVVYSDVAEKYEIDGGYSYRLALSYTYTVDGKSYEGSRQTFGRQVPEDEAVVELLAESFEPGEPVEVYYNPERPGQAVLYPGDTQGLMPVIVTGGVLFALGFVPLFRRRPRLES